MALIKCPFCAEKIQEEACKCRFCNEWLGGKIQAPSATGGWDAFVAQLDEEQKKIPIVEPLQTKLTEIVEIPQSSSMEVAEASQDLHAELDYQDQQPSSPTWIEPHLNQYGNNSGLGRHSRTPSGIRPFSWSPFFFPALWCAAHKAWIEFVLCLFFPAFALFTRLSTSKVGQQFFDRNLRSNLQDALIISCIPQLLLCGYIMGAANDLAWKNRIWIDIDQFKKVQSRWATDSCIFVIIFCLLVLLAKRP